MKLYTDEDILRLNKVVPFKIRLQTILFDRIAVRNNVDNIIQTRLLTRQRKACLANQAIIEFFELITTRYEEYDET